MKSKKIIIIILIIVALLIGIIYIYDKFIKEETIIIDLNIDVYSEKTLFDFKDEIDCNLTENKTINTIELGKQQITTHCRNNKNKKIKYIINFNVIDKEEPKIILKDSYTVTKGYQKNLTDVIISADNYDSKPTREIIGDYDFNKVGNYQLTYKVTDNSGNIATKNFTLHVIEPTKAVPSNSYIAFSDVVNEHKFENTQIGIDVSKWQGEINFKKVREAGAEFVIIRIGHQDGFNGDYIIDPYFTKNIENATKNNLKVGLYFYTYANSVEEAKKQANWIVNQLKNYELSLPIVYDWESWSNFNSLNLSLYEFNEVANTFLEEIEKNGYTPMLYSSKNYLENIWTNEKYKTWLAHYTNNTNYQGNYYMWQMCSDGKIDGINGYVDINILYQ